MMKIEKKIYYENCLIGKTDSRSVLYKSLKCGMGGGSVQMKTISSTAEKKNSVEDIFCSEILRYREICFPMDSSKSLLSCLKSNLINELFSTDVN